MNIWSELFGWCTCCNRARPDRTMELDFKETPLKRMRSESSHHSEDQMSPQKSERGGNTERASTLETINE